MSENIGRLLGRRVLLLSPHADDIAYSIGGTVAGAAAAAEWTLLTVFGRSAWALPPALRRQPTAVVSSTRREEDRAYCCRRNLGFVSLEFDDSAAAGYDDMQETTASPQDDPRTFPVVHAVRDCVARTGAQTVLAPCALGAHIDHRIVHEAARALRGVDLLFYEDVPYSAGLSLAQIDSGLAASGLRPAVSVDIGPVVHAKCDDMWLYRSQTSAATVGEMLLHAGRLGHGRARFVERLWNCAP